LFVLNAPSTGRETSIRIPLRGRAAQLSVRKAGAAAIIAFLASVSPVMHGFWSMEEPDRKMQEMVNFSKNMALLGSALAFGGVEEPWPLSVGAQRPNRVVRLVKVARQRLAA